jgi:2-oxoglutarate ferredoxin oxidoreductase subunit gamma
MTDKIIIAGFGGQGVITLGELIAFIAMKAGWNVTHYPSYGAEMRGGTANCAVTLSQSGIFSPVFGRPTSALVMNEPSFRKFEPMIESGGTLVQDSSRVKIRTSRTDVTEVRVDASGEADRLGQIRAANIVMLGAFLKKKALFDKAMIIEAIGSYFTMKKKSGSVDLNRLAFEAGYGQV